MYAIIATGGKQYFVKQDDILDIEKIEGEIGDRIFFDKVLLVRSDDNDNDKIGDPFVNGAKVHAEIISSFRGDKVITFKKKRRKGYHKTKGHRQSLLKVKILDVVYK